MHWDVVLEKNMKLKTNSIHEMPIVACGLASAEGAHASPCSHCRTQSHTAGWEAKDVDSYHQYTHGLARSCQDIEGLAEPIPAAAHVLARKTGRYNETHPQQFHRGPAIPATDNPPAPNEKAAH